MAKEREARRRGNNNNLDADLYDGMDEGYKWGQSQRHYCRAICGGAYDSEGLKGKSSSGGVVAPEKRYVAPTVLVCSRDLPAIVGGDSAIFGPILLVYPVEHEQDAVDEIHARHTTTGVPPTSMYLFTEDRELERRMLAVTRSKGVTVNGTVWHAFTREASRQCIDEFSSKKHVLRERGGRHAVPTGATVASGSASPYEPDRGASLLWNALASIYHELVDPSWPYPPWRGGVIEEQP